MKIVICPDSFKGSLSAQNVTECIAAEILALNPDIEIVKAPLADGGEGTKEIFQESLTVKKNLDVRNPVGEVINISYLTDVTEHKVFIESADIIGISLLKPKNRKPWEANSFGLGEAILSAISVGAKEIFISLGGSATCDCGIGMLAALGYRFLDKQNMPLSPTPANLHKICCIDGTNRFIGLDNTDFYAICDVNNPLTGPEGAAFIYGPQKGFRAEELQKLDNSLISFAKLAENMGFNSQNTSPVDGPGAAGGLGFALKAFLNAKMIRGIDYILETINFAELIDKADLIITGEGKVDRQSLMGKTINGVLKIASDKKIPVIVLAGYCDDREILLKSGISKIFEISQPNLSCEENMKRSQTIANIGRVIKENATVFSA